MTEYQHPGLTIVLLGLSGVGKSASGNTILGRPAFESKVCLNSVTKEITEETANVFGKQISVVDTPGILDSTDTEEMIKEYCQGLLESGRQCLFLVTVQVGRFTEEDKKAVTAAMRALGPKGMKKSYLLFTRGDTLKKAKMTLEEFLFKDKDESLLPSVVRMYAGAYHLFDNEDDDEEQVRELLQKSGHLSDEQQPTSTVDDSKNRRVVLLGLPGAGKSSSANSILGSDEFASDGDFNPVSTETVAESATVEGRRVTVVDTPGFTDEVLTPKQLYEEIMKTIVKASPGPHAFVIVVKIDRISKNDITLFKLLPKLFDSHARQYTMVLFTHGDKLKGRTMKDLIKKNRHVSKLVSMCGGRYCVFDNETNKKQQNEQRREFLHQVDEMVTANGGHFTSDLFRMAETFFNEENNQSGEPAAKAPTTHSSPSGGSDLEDRVWNRIRCYLFWALGVGAVVGAVEGAGVGARLGGVAGAVVGAVVGAGVGAGVVAGIGAVVGGIIGREALVTVATLTAESPKTKQE